MQTVMKRLVNKIHDHKPSQDADEDHFSFEPIRFLYRQDHLRSAQSLWTSEEQ